MGLNDGFSRMVGVKIDKEAFAGATQGKVQACVNEWFAQSEFAEIERNRLIDFDRWQPALNEIQSACRH
jgi:hypothetical protein